MKKLFLLLALVGVLGISCSDKEETTPNQPQTPTEQPEDNSGSENESPENDDDQVTNIPNNEIWYTTTDNNRLYPNSIEPRHFGALLVSNTYDNGKGILTFDGDIKVIGDSMFSGYYVYYNGGSDLSHFGYYTESCKSLTSISIPNSVTAIGDYAFSKCNNLTSITLSDNVTTIRSGAFAGCSSLSLLNVNIGDLAKYCTGNCTSNIPGKKHLFANNTEIIELTIPESVTTIGDRAFQGCSSLTSITIPESVTTIGDSAFSGCSSLTSVTIPDSVTTIGENAFYNCSSLTEFNGKYASEDGRCLIIDGTLYSFLPTGLTEYTIPDSVATIGDYAFYYCDSLTSVTIPDSVTSIGESAFSYCSSLTSVTIGDSVTTIGEWAFSHCSSLTSVTIGDCVTTIGDYAFYDCRSLTSVTIPDSVTTIGDEAFEDCSSLTSVYCKATTPPVGSSYMFYNNASGRKIYVPMESVEAYKAAYYWRDYADDIVGYNF